MNKLFDVMSREEYAAYRLRALYAEHGYSQYRMSKFEEYDLYVRNKDFLVSENVITFTDTDGKLLALKPDVTLSIIKNSKDVPYSCMKVYYNEHVYRVSGSTHSFKEIMQAGLECLGAVDMDTVTEVVYLAAKSLDTISASNVLELTHLDIVSCLLDECGLSKDGRSEVLSYLADKNAQGINDVCLREGLSDDKTALLERLVNTYGPASDVARKLGEFGVNDSARSAIRELEALIANLDRLGVSDKVYIDFSLVNDMKYYNGICLRGFVEGLPSGILSGGQYDSLMNKLGRNSRAIGFAVYLDEVSRLPIKES